jgi:hypothetical protein
MVTAFIKIEKYTIYGSLSMPRKNNYCKGLAKKIRLIIPVIKIINKGNW